MPDNPFCFEGHQLPELFLLGVQKCGTTSLTKQLFTEWGFFGDAQAKGLCTAENSSQALSRTSRSCAPTLRAAAGGALANLGTERRRHDRPSHAAAAQRRQHE